MNKNIIIVILIVVIIALGAAFMLNQSNGKTDTNIKIINNQTFKNGDMVQFELKDAQGNALSSQSVNITFDNNKNTVTTDQNGKGYLSIIGESAGKYDVEVKYGGNDKYNGCSAKVTITIEDGGNGAVASTQGTNVNSTVSSNSNGSSSSNLVYDSVYMVYYDKNTGIIPSGEWGGKSIAEYRAFIDNAYEHPEDYPELQ